MFLNELTYIQKKQFLGLATEILSVDGGIDSKEERYLRGLCGEMSLSRSDAAENPQHDITEIFVEPVARRIVIVELFGLAFANYEFHPKEKEYIETIGQKLAIEARIMESCKELVEEYGELEQRIAAVLHS